MTPPEVRSSRETGAPGDDPVTRKAHDPLAAIRDRIIDELEGSPRLRLLNLLRRIPGLLLVTSLFVLLIVSGLLSIYTLIR